MHSFKNIRTYLYNLELSDHLPVPQICNIFALIIVTDGTIQLIVYIC